MTSATTSSRLPQHYQRVWWAALAVFVLAGSTGALMRFGLLLGFPGGLQFTNVRHAHSHLMYFGWVTPALIALLATLLPRVTDRPLSTRFLRPAWLAILCGLLAYLPFLFYGYRTAELGGLRLPLSVIGAGLNVLSWYTFAWAYRQETRGLPRNDPLLLWDTAVLALLYATLGTWGLPLLTLFPPETPFWSLALTHLFLDTFAFGWFGLGVVGMLYALHPQASGSKLAHHSITAVTAGLPVLFLLGIPSHAIPAGLRWIGGLGGLLFGLGILGHVVVLGRIVARRWWVVLAFLALTAVTLLATIPPGVEKWATAMALRVPYLHWLLLGTITLALVLGAEAVWQVRGRRWMVTAVLGLLLTLMPLTGFWPGVWSGRWVLWAAAVGALLPVLAAIGMLAARPVQRNPAPESAHPHQPIG